MRLICGNAYLSSNESSFRITSDGLFLKFLPNFRESIEENTISLVEILHHYYPFHELLHWERETGTHIGKQTTVLTIYHMKILFINLSLTNIFLFLKKSDESSFLLKLAIKFPWIVWAR